MYIDSLNVEYDNILVFYYSMCRRFFIEEIDCCGKNMYQIKFRLCITSDDRNGDQLKLIINLTVVTIYNIWLPPCFYIYLLLYHIVSAPCIVKSLKNSYSVFIPLLFIGRSIQFIRSLIPKTTSWISNRNIVIITPCGDQGGQAREAPGIIRIHKIGTFLPTYSSARWREMRIIISAIQSDVSIQRSIY
jgi:hypothetical protein